MSTTRPDLDHDAVCACPHRHVLVTAPPGSGKTRLAARLAGVLAAQLPSPGPPASTVGARVLLLTFSNQAKAQLSAEVDALLTPQQKRRVEVSNYHSLAWWLVRAHRRALGLPLDLHLIGNRRRRNVLAEQAPAAYERLHTAAPSAIDELAEHHFAAFRDARTPDAADLAQLLNVIEMHRSSGQVTFGDLGALFWTLMETYPSIEAALLTRYPIVVADEHQDASALQDAIVRRLGRDKLVVLADELQLIHGWRGASTARLQQHRADCHAEFELTTPHRWSENPTAGTWLLEVRRRLLDQPPTPVTAPLGCRLQYTPDQHGTNGLKNPVLQEVRAARAAGSRRIAVLTRTNADVGKLRAYLTSRGQHCRESQGGASFEETYDSIDALTNAPDARSVAQHALAQVHTLFPALPAAAITQTRSRLHADGVQVQRAGALPRLLLEHLDELYQVGPHRYIAVLNTLINSLQARGERSPRDHTIRTIRRTAVRSRDLHELSAVLAVHAEHAGPAAHLQSASDTDGLFVMTVHHAKGKEFDAVILAPADKRSFPDKPEDRRLFYVALTRGRSRWSFITPAGTASPLLSMLQ